MCWGNNTIGQTDPPAGTYSAVSAGGNHSCALTTAGEAGEIVCWPQLPEGVTLVPGRRP